MLWSCEDYRPSHRLEFKLPDASLSWIINLRENRFRVFEGNRLDRDLYLPGSLIAGPRSSYYYLDTTDQQSCLGIRFKPGGALPFLGDLVGELKDADIPLQEGLGRQAEVDGLRERLQETTGAEQRFQCMERYLLRSLERRMADPRGHRAVAYALDRFDHSPADAPTIASLADMANLSTERFIRVFKQEVGLTPKAYASIARFKLAVRLIRVQRSRPDTEMALSCGYYDQAHLYREFHKYANMTPTELFHRQDMVNQHVPLCKSDG